MSSDCENAPSPQTPGISPQAGSAPRPPLPRRVWHKSRGWLALLAVFCTIKGCVLDQYTIPTNSMRPTLIGNWEYFRDDRVLVNKWVYGPRIPFTSIRLAQWDAPKRWDIVVFRSPNPDDEGKILIKRVAGLPGERVHIARGRLFVNGEPVEPPEDIRPWLHYISNEYPEDSEAQRVFLAWAQSKHAPSVLNPDNPGVQKLAQDIEAWASCVEGVNVDGLSAEAVAELCRDVSPESLEVVAETIHNFLRPQLQYGVREEEEFSRVPEGHYFMLGDNSANSGDGRIWGWVAHERIHGPAIAIWWPFWRRRDFTGFSHTWWGMALIYGIPAVLVLMDLAGYLRRRAQRQRQARGAPPEN